jgi:hypothetical protein
MWSDAGDVLNIDNHPHVRKLLLDVCLEMSQCAPAHIDSGYHLNFIEKQLEKVPVADLRIFDAFLGAMPWDTQLVYAYNSNPDLFHAVAPKGSDGQPLTKILDLVS